MVLGDVRDVCDMDVVFDVCDVDGIVEVGDVGGVSDGGDGMMWCGTRRRFAQRGVSAGFFRWR